VHINRMVPGEGEARAKGRFALFKVHAPVGQASDHGAEETTARGHYDLCVARLSQMTGGIGKVEAAEVIVNPPLQVKGPQL